MLQEAILKFRSSGPILLPAIIDNYWLGEIKIYEDYAVLPYEVHEPQPLEKVLDMFEMICRADGNFTGTQKYMLDYVMEPSYETGYIDAATENQPIFQAITQEFADF